VFLKINDTIIKSSYFTSLFLFTLIFYQIDIFPVFSQEIQVSDAETIKEKLKKGESEYARRSDILKDMSESQVDDITFIGNIYKMLLNRNVTAREMTGWVNRLGQGASRLLIIEDITSDDEYYIKHEITGFVNAGRARLMQKPTSDSTCVANLAKGVSFKVSSRSGGWYYVKLDNGQSGYLSEGSVNIELPVFRSSAVDNARVSSDTAEASLSNFEKAFGREISRLNETYASLSECLVKGGKYSYYEIKPGKLIEGEKYLAKFRALTSDLANKSEMLNSKNPLKLRIGKLPNDYKSLVSYETLSKTIKLQTANLDGAAIDVFRGGKSLLPNKYFESMDEKNSKIILETFKEETGYRKMKRYAVVDILNFGKALFQKRKAFFMKNAFGEYSNAVESDRYFVDFLNPEVRGIMFEYLDTVIESGYFDAIIIDDLRFPNHLRSNNDIRTIFAFNDSIVREFEKNTKFSISSLNEMQEDIFKKYASSRFESFIADLRRYFAAKKQPFYAVCDAEYYNARFDTRLCDFKTWGNNLDAVFVRYPASATEESIRSFQVGISKNISKPQAITIKTADPSKALDIVRGVNEVAPAVKGIFLEN